MRFGRAHVRNWTRRGGRARELAVSIPSRLLGRSAVGIGSLYDSRLDQSLSLPFLPYLSLRSRDPTTRKPTLQTPSTAELLPTLHPPPLIPRLKFQEGFSIEIVPRHLRNAMPFSPKRNSKDTAAPFMPPVPTFPI